MASLGLGLAHRLIYHAAAASTQAQASLSLSGRIRGRDSESNWRPGRRRRHITAGNAGLGRS